MMRPMLVILPAIILLSCNNNSQQTLQKADSIAAQAAVDSNSSAYFPVGDFLKSEIAAVDSTPVGIIKYVYKNGKVLDSSYIKSEEFHRLASEFVPDELREPQFTANFKENSFFDNSTGTATFFYSPRSGNSAVKRIDVLSSKGDVYDNIKSIYIEKTKEDSGSYVLKKLYWKPGRYFQTIVQTTKENSKPVTQLTKVVWDNRD